MKKSKWIAQFGSVFIFVLIMGVALACGTAMGQNNQNNDDQDEFLLEEVIVTAEFQEKRVQKTPLSITAINADSLEMRNQVSLEQIAVQSPNVTLRPGNATYGSSLVAYIRGIGQTDFNPSVEAGVGIYVDDVYYSTITGNVLDLLDLDRVEVLRGPQGTLAGRNALGGAIKLFSRKPEGRNEGYFSTTIGSFDRLDIRGAADFSITDNLFMRIAGTSRSRDGYVTSYDYACYNKTPAYGSPGGVPTFSDFGKHDCVLAKEGGQSTTAARISLRWLPSDNFEVNFATNIVNDKSGGQPSVLIAAKDLSAPPFPLNPVFFDNNGNGIYDDGIDVPYDSRFTNPGTYMNYSTYGDSGLTTPNAPELVQYQPADYPRVNHLDAVDFSLNLDWQLSDNVALKSITAYREYTNLFSDDTDGSPLTVSSAIQRMKHDQWTQELRLNATLFDEFADTTVGAFYLDQETTEDGHIFAGYGNLIFIHGPDPVPATSKAAYGQANLHLTDRMNLTLGLRYSKDEKSYTFQRHNPDGSEIQPVPGAPNFVLGGLSGLSVSYSSDRIDYRAALDYSFTDQLMVYGQIATGYRAGGNNARPFIGDQLHVIKPEELTNYEVGMKSTLFDQLRLNASVFFNDYKDIQLPLTSCYFSVLPQLCASPDNVGDAEVKGFELEGVWQPTKAFALDFSYAYLNFEYTRIRIDPSSGQPLFAGASSVPPYTPKNEWSVGAQYRFDLGSWGDLTPRLDVSWQDEINASTINTVNGFIDAYYLVNGRATWRSGDSKWEVSLEGTNLTDEYYYLTIFDLFDIANFANAQPGRPREWAVGIKRVWYFL